MAAIILPGRWNRQPSGNASVNRGHPLAAGLKVAYAPWLGDVNLVTGKRLSLTGTDSSIQPGLSGIGRVWTAESVSTYLNEGIGFPSGFTALGVIRPDATDELVIFRNKMVSEGNGGQMLRLSAGQANYVWAGTKSIATDTVNPAATVGKTTCVALSVTSALNPHNYAFYANGRAGTAGTSGDTIAVGSGYDIGGSADGAIYQGKKALYLVLVWDRALSVSEAVSATANPWQIFDNRRILYFNTGGGGTTITGSGTPTAQASTVAGTAERSVTGSGAPSAQASTVAGVAERVITSSGTLSAQSSTVSGSGTVGGVFTGSGTLQAQSSTVSGTAERSVTGTGTPASQAATVSGTAERVVTGAGTPASQASTVSGTGQVGNVVTGSGTPTAQAATVSGTAERTVTASGAVSAQSSTVAGTAERTITGSGSLQSQSSTVYGFDSVPAVPDTGGGGSRTVAFSSRKLRKELEEWEQKNQDKERLKRLMREDEELVLIMLALAA